ncbi:MAG TPA: FkbM family methyltransferase [Thermoleophilaceae bacterium]
MRTPRGLWRAARYRRMLRNLAGPRLLAAFAHSYPEAFFVEIGSNDGEQHDHLRPFILASDWRGIMVEPVPYVFERLRRTYGAEPRLTLENAAVAERDGVLPFFHMRDASAEERELLPDWYDGIGSFSRDAVLGHIGEIPDIEERIVRAEVTALTFESLCSRHGVQQVDLLVIDTEGYDWRILRSIDLEAHSPRLIVYEHYHLSEADRRAAAEHLRRHGYETIEEGFDTFCLDTREVDGLTQTWRTLRPAVGGVAAYEEAA